MALTHTHTHTPDPIINIMVISNLVVHYFICGIAFFCVAVAVLYCFVLLQHLGP